MEIYLVGGAVRDELLGRPVTERDWVVVGSTPEAMKQLGYRQVGRDFPVFLHPESAEEYALARTERKSGPGHTGFVCHAGPDVTLEDDLRRRDLTVNAMARHDSGTLVDPFGGRRDLDARLLRHVSAAFTEDPLRVFRVARFAAQLPGFSVAPETQALIARMAAQGQLAELSAERVWQELFKALGSAAPRRFFDVLAEAGALSPWLSELQGLESAVLLCDRPSDQPFDQPAPEQRFASFGWELTPEAVTRLCDRLKAPNRFRRLARQVAEHGTTLADWRAGTPEQLLDALAAIGAFRPGQDPEPLLTHIERCRAARLDDLRGAIRRLGGVSAVTVASSGLQGKALGDAIRRERLRLLREALA